MEIIFYDLYLLAEAFKAEVHVSLLQNLQVFIDRSVPSIIHPSVPIITLFTTLAMPYDS